jgi:spore coat polysaccharide biosynthesis predicted glycosyltransferase SpsG
MTAVVFRADASHAIGLGHVARLCAVIEELAAAGGEPIAMFGGDDAVATWLAGQRIEARLRPPIATPGAPPPWSAADLLAIAEQPGVRAVVVDGPPLAAALAPALIDRGIRTIVIDDRGDVALAVDAIVNHNFHAPALAASYPAARRCLLGRRFLMLRHAVRRHGRGACQPQGVAPLRVVVTFGGSDPVGATARTLRLVPAERPLALHAIAGPGFRDLADLHAAAATARAAGHTVDVVCSPDDPARLFIDADAAICSAGGTLGELAYLGCPALAFAIVPDQIHPVQALASGGLVAGGDRWSDIDDDALQCRLRSFLGDDARRRDLRQRALATVDGDGARRVVCEALGEANTSEEPSDIASAARTPVA